MKTFCFYQNVILCINYILIKKKELYEFGISRLILFKFCAFQKTVP